jgi:hypothetical protein
MSPPRCRGPEREVSVCRDGVVRLGMSQNPPVTVGDRLRRRSSAALPPEPAPTPSPQQIRNATKGALLEYIDTGRGYRARAREELAARESGLYAKWALFFAVLSLTVAIAALLATLGPTEVRVVKLSPEVQRSLR